MIFSTFVLPSRRSVKEAPRVAISTPKTERTPPTFYDAAGLLDVFNKLSSVFATVHLHSTKASIISILPHTNLSYSNAHSRNSSATKPNMLLTGSTGKPRAYVKDSHKALETAKLMSTQHPWYHDLWSRRGLWCSRNFIGRVQQVPRSATAGRIWRD